ERKQQLHRIFQQWRDSQHVQSVNFYENKDELKDIVFSYKGEGIIAKRRDSLYIPGKNHHDWLKIKNWRNVQGFLTAFNTENQYFTVEVFDDSSTLEIGKCKHGMDEDTRQTVKKLFTGQGKKHDNTYTLPPAICASIRTLDLYED